jgi:hypothetical protein
LLYRLSVDRACVCRAVFWVSVIPLVKIDLSSRDTSTNTGKTSCIRVKIRLWWM